MDKKHIIIVLILLVLILSGGIYFWKTKTKKLTTGVINQTENVQSANPYSATNPYSDIKVNPFE